MVSQSNPPKPRPIASRIKANLILLTVITLEELSQLFIPSRSFDIIDWLADLIGLAVGQTAVLLCKRLSEKITHASANPS